MKKLYVLKVFLMLEEKRKKKYKFSILNPGINISLK